MKYKIWITVACKLGDVPLNRNRVVHNPKAKPCHGVQPNTLACQLFLSSLQKVRNA
jgi:hypothetical protein